MTQWAFHSFLLWLPNSILIELPNTFWRDFFLSLSRRCRSILAKQDRIQPKHQKKDESKFFALVKSLNKTLISSAKQFLTVPKSESVLFFFSSSSSSSFSYIRNNVVWRIWFLWPQKAFPGKFSKWNRLWHGQTILKNRRKECFTKFIRRFLRWSNAMYGLSR